MQATSTSNQTTPCTLQRVIFENGHCLLPKQENLHDYNSILDDDIRLIAGRLLTVHDTNIPAPSTDGTTTHPEMTLRMENICGGFRGFFENIDGAGSLMSRGAPRVAKYIKHKQFVGTHYLFHTIHGRLAYRMEKKTWSFKGVRSVEDLVGIVRNLTQDNESPIYPVVNMLSVTLRTDTAIVIDPAHSLMQRVLERLYSHVVRMQPRLDDTNNLFFMQVIDWKELLLVVENDRCRGMTGSLSPDNEVECVREYLKGHANDPDADPNVSIGYTRKGIYFIRICFPKGCTCEVLGSEMKMDGVDTPSRPLNVSKGGIEPFVGCIVRFVVLVLVRMRSVGAH